MKNTFIRGAIILTVCALIGKVIGAFYRIPFAMIVGAEGVGLYQLVYPLYTFILTVSTSGLPSSISKLLSESYAKNQNRLAQKYFKFSMIIIIVLSVVGTFFIAMLSPIISSWQGNSDATLCYIAISPAVLFAGIVAGLRGYFQAKENVLPTAVSGLIEQVCKVGVGLALAYFLKPYGIVVSVVGALVGVSVSEILASVFMLISFVTSKRKTTILYNDDEQQLKNSKVIKNILSISIPVALGGLVMPVTLLIDSGIIVRILSKTFGTSYSTMVFGLQSGVVGSLSNLPVVASIAAQTVILPQISREKTQNNEESMKKSVKNSFLFVLLVSVPCAICYFLFSSQIIAFLYGRTFSNEQMYIASRLVRISSLNIVALSVAQLSAGVLQGLGKVKTPVVTLIVGAVVKIASVVLLVSRNSINIYGAEYSDIICYAFVSVLNIAVIHKNLSYNFGTEIVKVFTVSTIVGFVAYFAKKYTQISFSQNMSLVISGIIILVFYFACLGIVIYDIKKKEKIKKYIVSNKK